MFVVIEINLPYKVIDKEDVPFKVINKEDNNCFEAY